ncbi:MAG: hypothetical protein COA69_13420 [Robiginitomaculum sp.]|nr:MAG: hypothetical protein COA69_13420 [Robiginitomaculum sp.]
MAVTIDPGRSGADQLEAHKVVAYSENVFYEADKHSHLEQTVMSDLAYAPSGVSFTDNTYASTSVKDVGDEFAQHDSTVIRKGTRQFIFANKYLSDMVGKQAAAEELTDPVNATVIAQGKALGLFRDQFIGATLFAPVLEAEDDAVADPANPINHHFVSKTFPTGQIVAVDDWEYYMNLAEGESPPPVSGPSGLTLPKIYKMDELLDDANITSGGKHIKCSRKDILTLLTSTRMLSKDYREQATALRDGKTKEAFGFTFHIINKAAQVGYGTAAAEVAAYYGDAILYKERQIVTARVHERKDRHSNWEAYMRFGSSGGRRDDLSVVKALVSHV